MFSLPHSSCPKNDFIFPSYCSRFVFNFLLLSWMLFRLQLPFRPFAYVPIFQHDPVHSCKIGLIVGRIRKKRSKVSSHTSLFLRTESFRKLRFCMPASLPAQFVSALCPIRCPCMVCSACRKMKGGAFLAKFKTRLPSGCFLIGIQALIDYAGRQESDFVEPIPQKSQTEPDKSL